MQTVALVQLPEITEADMPVVPAADVDTMLLDSAAREDIAVVADAGGGSTWAAPRSHQARAWTMGGNVD